MLAIIGRIIRQLREENGISLEELSARAGISTEKLDKIEKNETNASLGVLIRISRALGAKVGALAVQPRDAASREGAGYRPFVCALFYV